MVLQGVGEFDKDTDTNFRGQNGVLYKLQDIWFLLAHRDTPWLNYVKKCNEFKFGIVSFLDHKDILQYLTGVKDTCSKIVAVSHTVSAAALPTSIAANASSSTAPRNVSLPSLPPIFPSGAAPAAPAASSVAAAAPASAAKFAAAVSSTVPASTYESQPSLMNVLDDDRPYNFEGVDDEESRPLTEQELRAKRRKEETAKDHAAEMEEISQNREQNSEVARDAAAVAEIRALERPSVAKGDLMRSNTRNFKHFLNLMFLRQNEGKYRKRGATANEQEAKKQSQRDAASGSSGGKRERGRSASTTSLVDPSKQKKVKAVTIPIIIVPGGVAGNVSLANAADLLEKGQWAPARRQDRGDANKRVLFKHKTLNDDGAEVESQFEICCDTSRFTKNEWDRVIAIFTNGKEWEFKGWKLGDTATMFNRVSGFYVAFKGDTVPVTITNWKVTVLWLDKLARHSDITAQRFFWEIVRRESAKELVFQGVF